MLIESEAPAGEVEEVFVGHIRITRMKTNFQEAFLLVVIGVISGSMFCSHFVKPREL